jgi:hypothetical protein
VDTDDRLHPPTSPCPGRALRDGLQRGSSKEDGPKKSGIVKMYQSGLPSVYWLDVIVLDERQNPDTPETRLFLSILKDAIHTALSDSRKMAKYEAIAWINSDDDSWIFSFVSICDAFGVEPTWLRKKIGRLDSRSVPEELAPHPYIKQAHCRQCRATYSRRYQEDRKAGRKRDHRRDIIPSHPYVQESHCRECYRTYHRLYKRGLRDSLRGRTIRLSNL